MRRTLSACLHRPQPPPDSSLLWSALALAGLSLQSAMAKKLGKMKGDGAPATVATESHSQPHTEASSHIPVLGLSPRAAFTPMHSQSHMGSPTLTRSGSQTQNDTPHTPTRNRTHSASPESELKLPRCLITPHSPHSGMWSHTHTHTHTHTQSPSHAHTLAVLLCFVRINEKSSRALRVISVLGVK